MSETLNKESQASTSISITTSIQSERRYRRKVPGSDSQRYKWSSSREFIFITLATTLSITMFEKNYMRKDSPISATIYHRFAVEFFVAMPMLYLQIFIGQYSQLGASQLKYMVPILHGLGYSMVGVCILRLVKFGQFQSDLLMYGLITLQSRLPWMYCPPKYNYSCFSTMETMSCTANCVTKNITLASFSFWQNIYMRNPNVEEGYVSLGIPSWNRCVTLIFTWFLALLFLINFLHYYRKIMTVLVIFTTAIMVVIVSIMLLTPGNTEGIYRIIAINPLSLVNMIAWSKSVGNALEDLALGRAIHIMHGSFLQSHHQIGVLIASSLLINYLQSILCSIITAMTTAVISTYSYTKIEDFHRVTKKMAGPKILTIIPSGLGHASASQLWTFLFFISCVCIIGCNQIVHLLILEKSITDTWPIMLRYRKYTFGLLILAIFLISTLFLSNEAFVLTNDLVYGVVRALDVFNSFIFAVMVCYIYGVQRICDDIHYFTGQQPSIFWKVCFYALPFPIFLPFSFHTWQMPFVNNTVKMVHIFCMSIFLSPILIFACIEFTRYARIRNLIGLFKPKERWGPTDPEERHLRRIFNPRKEIRARRRREVCKHKCILGSKVLSKFCDAEESVRKGSILQFEAPSMGEIGED